MSKPFKYWFRLALATSLSATLIISPAWAGRLFKCRSDAPTKSNCVSVVNSGCEVQSPCEPDPCCQPVEQADDCCQPVEQADDCCEEVVMSSDDDCSPTANDAPTQSPANPEQEQSVAPDASPSDASGEPPAPPQPGAAQNPMIDATSAPEPAAEVAPDLTPIAEPESTTPAADAAPLADSATEPAVDATAEPAVDATAEPAVDAMPQTADETDLFSQPSTPADATEPAADVFGQESDATAPATTDEGLFGQPEMSTETPSDTAPVDTVPADDLFGTPTTPATDTPPPATDPAPAAADDLFGSSSGESAPATSLPDTPATSAPDTAADLFSEPATDSMPAAADDLFGSGAADSAPATTDGLFDAAPADAPAPTPAPANATPAPAGGDAIDDLFKSTSNEGAFFDEQAPIHNSDQSAPISTPSSDEQIDNELNKLFDTSFNDNAEPTFRGAESRVWVDNTGNYTVQGRLVTIFTSEVRLMKENGKTTTVPLRRLSKADLAYVYDVYAALTDKSAERELLVKINSENNSKTETR